MFKLKELCFEITNSCYLNCIYCSSFNDSDRQNSEIHLSLSVVKTVVDDFCTLGGEVLELSGGEPLMHPEIYDIVDYAMHKNVDVIIYTSGVLPSSYSFEEILNELQKLGLKKIVFNCQGLNDTHDALVCRKDAFIQLVDSIEYSKTLGLWTGVHFVPSKQNYSQIEDVYNFLANLNVDEIALLRLVKQGRAVKNWSLLELAKIEYLKFFKMIYRLLNQKALPVVRLGCPFNIANVLWPDRCEVRQCHAGKSSLDIMSNGNVIPCPAFKDISAVNLGNIHTDRLIDIWRNNKYLKMLRNANISQINICKNCNFLSLCRGGCIAQRLIINKSIYNGPDPLCLKKRRLSNDK